MMIKNLTDGQVKEMSDREIQEQLLLSNRQVFFKQKTTAWWLGFLGLIQILQILGMFIISTII